MKNDTNYDEIRKKTFETVILSTWAEASLQGLQEIWGMPSIDQAWAASGYLGAINSGQTTCGLLIGCGMAIGLRIGEDCTCLPLQNKKARKKAVAAVHLLYEDFLHEFRFTQCQEMVACDFSQDGEIKRYEEEKIYEGVCFNQFNFIMDRFIELDKQGKF